jgi:hypothetical protein
LPRTSRVKIVSGVGLAISVASLRELPLFCLHSVF